MATSTTLLMKGLPKRVAMVGVWSNEDLDVLLDEIESIEARLDERCAASGGENTWDESELVEGIVDNSEVVTSGDERLVSEVVAHRRELRNEASRQNAKEQIPRRLLARDLDSDLPSSLGKSLPARL